MSHFLLVCAAGALGTGARYTLNLFRLSFSTTLIVNAIGSFLMAFFVFKLASSSQLLRDFVLIGLLGGFTTYSAFNQESLQLIQSGSYSKAISYIATMLVVCLVCGFLGFSFGRRF